MFTKEEFKSLFPHDAYENESDPRRPKKGQLMGEIPFNTERSNDVNLKVDRTWPLGNYIAELCTKDKDGVAVSDIARFTLIEPAISRSTITNYFCLKQINQVQVRRCSPVENWLSIKRYNLHC